MVKILIAILAVFWIYKLGKILWNSKELKKYSDECRELERKRPGLSAKLLRSASESYQMANKKITTSRLIWFFIEVGSLIGIYFFFKYL